jgi:hypothetical protein
MIPIARLMFSLQYHPELNNAMSVTRICDLVPYCVRSAEERLVTVDL